MLYRIQFKLAEAPISKELIVEASDIRIIRVWCQSVIDDVNEAPDSFEIVPFRPLNVDSEVKLERLWMDLGETGG